MMNVSERVAVGRKKGRGGQRGEKDVARAGRRGGEINRGENTDSRRGRREGAVRGQQRGK